MKIRQRKVISTIDSYISDDGTEFDNEEDCRFYENHNFTRRKRVDKFYRSTKRLPRIEGKREEIYEILEKSSSTNVGTRVLVTSLNRVIGFDVKGGEIAAYYFDEYDYKIPNRTYAIGSWNKEDRSYMLETVEKVIHKLRYGDAIVY